MVPAGLEGILVSTEDTLHGAVRFARTRVFAQTLFDYVLNGERLETFLEHFPEVTRDQAEAVLAWENGRLRKELGFDLAS